MPKLRLLILGGISLSGLLVLMYALTTTSSTPIINEPLTEIFLSAEGQTGPTISTTSQPMRTFTPTEPAVRSHTLLPPSQGIYHAAFANFGAREDRVEQTGIEAFQDLVGKEIVWGYFSNNWFGGIVFPEQQIRTLDAQGVIPFVRLMPRSRFQSGGTDPVYTLQNIIDGEFDATLRTWAARAKEVGIPLLIEFGTEVNGNWFTWSGASNGGGATTTYGDPELADGPERFRDAYRHIVELFREEDATNITWFFHVNLTSSPDTAWNRPGAYYPGDEYVDWIGISVYGAQYGSDTSRSFTSLMDRSFNSITAISDTKPIALLEFGVVERSDIDKAAWIQNALESIAQNRYPRIQAVSYWHSRWTNADGFVSNMRLDSSAESLEAYRELIQEPVFVTTPRWAP